ncbi:hypothetical protein TNCV_3640451 [Trichonephila clavipes]|nr:hypothetical protein TNCV_3640451 [Trichonephila clavipes]
MILISFSNKTFIVSKPIAGCLAVPWLYTTTVKKFPEWSPTFTQVFVRGEIPIAGVGRTNKESTQPSRIHFHYWPAVGVIHRSLQCTSLEQRANIKLCVWLEKSPELLKMLKRAYGNYSSSREFVPVSKSKNEI